MKVSLAPPTRMFGSAFVRIVGGMAVLVGCGLLAGRTLAILPAIVWSSALVLTMALLQLNTEVALRRRGTEALLEIETIKSAIIDAALDAVITIDAQSRVVEWNRAAERIFGYSRAVAMGADMAELIIPPRLRANHHQGLGRFLESGTGPVLNKLLELPAVRADGSEFEVEIYITPIETAGRPLFTGFVRDITSRRESEAALGEREQLLRILTDHARVGMVMITVDRRFVFANSAYVEMLRLPDYDIVGKFVPDVLGASYQSQVRPLLDQAFAGERVSCELEMPSPEAGSGSHFFAATYDPPVDTIHGQCVIVVLVDITERKLAEQEMQRRTEQFRVVVETSPNAMLIVARDGAIATINRAAERLFGYTREELIGQPVEILVPDRFRAHHPGFRGGFHADPRERAMGAGRDLFARHRDGSDVPVEIGLTPINLKEGLFTLATITDITARKLAEEDIRELNAGLEHRVSVRTEQLEMAVKELDAFSYSVSHDLRAPLRAVDGFSRMVTEDYAARLDDEGRRMLDVIRSETQRMGRLIDDLLAFSRLGRQQMAPVEIDMDALVREVFDELFALETGRTVHLDPHPLPHAIGELAMIRQLWMNLIGNAIKFTQVRETGEIEIGVQDDGRDAPIYYIKDNGAGFDMRYVGKLFGIFQRLHTQHEFQGTGVGLALVQRIVQRHGGRVWAEAEVDHGATFFFTLPMPKS